MMKTPSLLTFAVLLQTCNNKESLVTVEPSKAEVTGRYQLSRWAFSSKLDAEISSNAASAYIDLREDGTLTFHQVPVVPDSGGRTFFIERLHTGNGTYTITALGSTSKSEFYGLNIDSGSLPDPMDTPRLRASEDSFTLSFEYFDGSFVQRMAFTRKANTKAENATPSGSR